MFEQLQEINRRPEPFSVYTTEELWTDPHTSDQMLKYHLNEDLPLASRSRDTIDRSVAWLAKRFNIGPDTAIADFGCGPGLYSSRFARLGAQVTGIDFSETSLAYARNIAARDNLEIEYIRQNYLDYASEQRYDLICMIFCDFCVLNPQQRARLLEIFREHLNNDGAIVLDVATLAAFAEREEQASYAFRQLDGFWSAKDYYGFVNTFKYEAEKVMLDKYSLFEKERSWTIYNWLQYFSWEGLTDELKANGLEVCETFGDMTGAPLSDDSPEMAVVIRKEG